MPDAGSGSIQRLKGSNMNGEDEAFGREMDFVLRKARELSLAILAGTAILSFVAVAVMQATDPGIFVNLALTTSVVMSAWVTRRVILEIPQHRRLLADPKLARSREVVKGMVAMDAVAFLISTAASLWLLSHLVNVD